jgi:hypothetical protein
MTACMSQDATALIDITRCNPEVGQALACLSADLLDLALHVCAADRRHWPPLTSLQQYVLGYMDRRCWYTADTLMPFIGGTRQNGYRFLARLTAAGYLRRCETGRAYRWQRVEDVPQEGGSGKAGYAGRQ